MRVIQRAIFILYFVCALHLFAFFPPIIAIAQDEKEKVVEIYNQNKLLIGTGTSISFSGLILTAKHILEDTDEAGAKSPNYLLRVLIRSHVSTEYEPADLLIAHPFMDLAILIKRFGKAIPTMPIVSLKDLKAGSSITLIGHRQSSRGNELYKERIAEIDEIDRHGHIIVGRGVQKGTSGGPAIYNGRLIGVIRSSTFERTTIVPIEGALEYFQLMGVKFSPEGLAFESDDIAKLANKASLYEQILMDIQMDVNWIAEMKPKWKNDIGKDFPDDITLQIWYQKKLSTQPHFDSHISIEAFPIFESTSFKSIDSHQRKKFTRAKWLLVKNGRVGFANFVKDIEALLKREYVKAGIRKDEFRGFNIIAKISSIGEEGFIKVPKEQSICFSLLFNTDIAGIEEGIREVGHRCVSGNITKEFR